jgi:hypothetical protein
MPSSVVDPAVVKFIESVAQGASSAADSVAGIMIRALGRICALETKVEEQAAKLKQVDKLARQPKPVRPSSPSRVVESGVDVRDGGPVYIEHKICRARGRPKGAKDRFPRSRHNLGAEVSSNFVDRDWDDLGG